VRLRFINGSSMSFFDVRIPDLKMTVVAADGQDIEPVTVDEFRIGTAEVFDVIVGASRRRAYRSLRNRWIAPATRAEHSRRARACKAPVPPLDARALVTMAIWG